MKRKVEAFGLVGVEIRFHFIKRAPCEATYENVNACDLPKTWAMLAFHWSVYGNCKCEGKTAGGAVV